MAVKCILTGQTPSVLDGVTENVQTQIDDKQPKIIADGILKGDGNSNISAAVKGTDYDTEIGIVYYEDSFDSVEAAYNKSKRLFCSENPADYVGTDSAKLYALLNRSQPYISGDRVEIKYTFTCLDKTITLTRTKRNSTATPVDTWAKGSQAFNPRLHASTHKTGGSDAIAPSDIGAQTKITANGVLKGDGSGNISAATATDIPGLDGKQATITGAATTITDNNLTANRALISNSSGKVEVSSVTSTELGYLDGVTSNIQTQLNNKLSSAPVTSVNNKTGAVSLGAKDVGAQPSISANGILKGDGSGNITAASETEVELVSLPNICNPNLLDNWYFGNPVNQRGQTEYPASNGVTYTIDRWIQNASGVKINDGYTTIGGAGGIFERIENIDMLVGKLLTFSVLTTDGLYTGTVTFNKAAVVFVDRDNLLVLYNSYFNGFQIAPREGVKNIKAAKLELGSQQTLAHQENGAWVLNEIPDYGEQLRRCQRYFFRSNFGSVSPVDGAYTSNQTSAINNLIGNYRFPVAMRTKPSVKILSLKGTEGKIGYWSSSDDAPYTVAVNTQTVGLCGFNSVESSASISPNIYAFHVEASADL